MNKPELPSSLSADIELRNTPLYDLHLEHGGKMVDFAGWAMPVQYGMGIMGEHLHCRQKAALFDVSHMGQVTLRPADPAVGLQDIASQMEALVPSDLISMPIGKARYTLFTNQDGGIMDDLIVSNCGDHLFVVLNAAMRSQDISHMHANLAGVEIHELTDHALLALQGPLALDVLASLLESYGERQSSASVRQLKFMQTAEFNIGSVPCRVSRLGYTGEDGFELSIPAINATEIARELLGHEDCALAGLGARDTLRLESGLCLYGNDIDHSTSPVEAELAWTIPARRRKEGGFPGFERIHQELIDGVARQRVGIRAAGRAIARQGTDISSLNAKVIGSVTSGSFSPSLQAPIAMAYVESKFAEVDTQINLIVRGKPHLGSVCMLPFVAQNYQR